MARGGRLSTRNRSRLVESHPHADAPNRLRRPRLPRELLHPNIITDAVPPMRLQERRQGGPLESTTARERRPERHHRSHRYCSRPWPCHRPADIATTRRLGRRCARLGPLPRSLERRRAPLDRPDTNPPHAHPQRSRTCDAALEHHIGAGALARRFKLRPTHTSRRRPPIRTRKHVAPGAVDHVKPNCGGHGRYRRGGGGLKT